MKVPTEEWFTHKAIIACERCGGSGIRKCKELTDYHRGDYDCWNEYCSFCGGEGRVIQNTYTARLEIELPRNQKKYETLEFKDIEKLDGRKTADFYKIGRK